MMTDSSMTYTVYLYARQEAGWTLLRFQAETMEIRNWMLEHVGDEHPGACWDNPKDNVEWEELGGGEYLIRNPNKAMLAKLTWA